MKTKSSRFFNLQDSLFKYLLIAVSLIVVLFFFALFYMLIEGSIPSFRTNGTSSITGTVWDIEKGLFGSLPAIMGTLVSAIIATLVAIPVSLGIAIYFTEYAPLRIKPVLSLLIDLLAAIPSVIYGIWGLWVIAPMIKNYIEQPIVGSIGFIPIFSGPAYGISIFLASIILTIMVIPIISSLSIELLSSTPSSLREGLVSLGATKWETVRHIGIPFARLGIFAAIILGLGRALGETMAVTMVIGNSYVWPIQSASIFAPATTITSKIASELYEATSTLHISSLMELALILLVVTLLVNYISRTVINRISKRGYS